MSDLDTLDTAIEALWAVMVALGEQAAQYAVDEQRAATPEAAGNLERIADDIRFTAGAAAALARRRRQMKP